MHSPLIILVPASWHVRLVDSSVLIYFDNPWTSTFFSFNLFLSISFFIVFSHFKKNEDHIFYLSTLHIISLKCVTFLHTNTQSTLTPGPGTVEEVETKPHKNRFDPIIAAELLLPWAMRQNSLHRHLSNRGKRLTNLHCLWSTMFSVGIVVQSTFDNMYCSSTICCAFLAYSGHFK